MNEKLEVTKYNSTIFNNKPTMYGIGTICYGLRITEKSFEFVFFAKPETIGNFEKKDLFEFNHKCNISKEAVTNLVSDLKNQFFNKFPDSENYFNKIESLSESKYNDYLGLAVSSSSGIYMTNKYFQARFKLIEESMNCSLDDIKIKQAPCTLL